MTVRSERPRLQLRIKLGDEIAFGPGKADLLEGIAAYGSIAAAGRAMGMSYKRAWRLVEQMNRIFRFPLVEAGKGGAHGGGTRLTKSGSHLLARYRALQRKAETAASAELAAFARAIDRR